MSITGGCQCGAVRFRIQRELGEASICHCRMCQKAMGGFFGPFVGAPFDALVWTRGLAIGALDRPGDVRLSEQLASPARVPYFEELAKLPEHRTDEPRAVAHLASIVSYQHPDHDTAEWPPKF